MIMASGAGFRGQRAGPRPGRGRPGSRRPRISACRVSTMLVRPGSGRPSASWVFRPMMIGLPQVSLRKCFRSRGSFQGRAPSRPIRPSRLIATTSESFTRSGLLDGDLAAEGGMGAIADQSRTWSRSTLGQVGDRRIELQPGERQRLAAELLVDLVEMVRVDVRIAEGVHELAGRPGP